MFDDLMDANHRYQASFEDRALRGRAARGLAVVTCIDSRIDPLAMLGLQPGDAKIIRNAGGRVTDDALRSLVLATNLLGVTRICLAHHTDCAMVGSTDDELHERIEAATGVDSRSWTLWSTTDQAAALHQDVDRLRSCAELAPGVEVGAFVLDVHTGALLPVDVAG